METRILIPSVLMVVQVKEENKLETNRRGNGESSDETEIADSHSYSDSSCVSSSSSDEESEKSDRRSRRVFKNRKKRRRKTRNESSKDFRGSVRLCAKESIEKGIIFGPNEGEIRIHHLHGVPNLLPEDVRYLFGCFDRLTSDPLDDSTEIRLCNWVRFLRHSLPQHSQSQDNLRFSRSPCSSEDEVEVNKKAGESPNVFAKYIDGRPVFEVKEVIPQGKELIATFDIASLTYKHSKGLDGPLDLTKGSSPPPPCSPSKCSSVTPPPKETTKESQVALPKPPLHQVKLSSGSSNKLFQPYSDDFLQQRRSGMRSFLQSTPNSQSQPQGTATNSIQSSTQPTPVLVRPILRTRGRERSLLPCEVCGKAFDRPSLLKRHMRTHTGEKPHVCDVCSKGFSTSSSLNTHRRIHSGEKPHVCPVCGKRFTASSNLYYHRMTHNKEKPHKCVLCGKSFPTPGDLKSHQYVHSGSWPFTCPVCHRGFSKQTNLRNHLLLHSGDKPHNCHICSKKFALACNLRAHLRTHEESDNLLLTSTSSKDDSSFSGEKSVTSDSKPPSSLQMPPLLPLPRPTHHSPGGPQGISNALRSSPYPSHSYIHPFLQLSRGGSGVPCSAAGGPTHPAANPFLERLFQWNLDFAQSAVGNLSVMQQRLVESQMLAAQLMIHGSTSSSTSSATQQQQPLTPPAVSSLHSPMMFGFGGGIVGFEELLARIRPLSNSAGLHGNSGSNGSASGNGGSIDLSKLMRQ